MPLFVGVDIGGTFTDLVIFDEKTDNPPAVFKVPTNPKRPETAVIHALESGLGERNVSLLSHATTIATNALLTHRGLAKTALITNNGFKDIIEIGRQRRPEIYNLRTNRPIAIIKRSARFVVKERTLSNGSIAEPLAVEEFRGIAQEIAAARFPSVAVSFLNSYANPQSEKRAERILRKSGYDGHIDLSSQVDPQYREYERTSTTVVNASLAPTISDYLQRLKAGLKEIGIKCPVYVMNSDGTASTTSQASKRPISIIESGPAAGVLSSNYLAKLLSLGKVITFDMGGTTAKAGAIADGIPDLAYEFEAAGRTYHGKSIKGSGYPVRQPFIDLAEVSAGGGTIARLDETGSLQVGPESAGADPGPAAYGKGGKHATVTDAHIIAGRINPRQLLGGKLILDYGLAAKALGRLGRGLGVAIDKVAESILGIVNNSMSKALSLVSIERGRDPREYTLVAFGGAGPLHACDLAQELGIRRIIVPLHPGLFSAFGLLTAELSRTFSQPILSPATHGIERQFKLLRKQARATLKEEGFTAYTTLEQIDLRYVGQAYEITIPYRKTANLTRLFGQEHKRLYGYSTNHEVEAVNARLRASIPTPRVKLSKKTPGTTAITPAGVARRAWLLDGWRRVPVYDRELLSPGNRGRGPCIIEEYDATSVVGTRWSWKIDGYGDIDLALH